MASIAYVGNTGELQLLGLRRRNGTYLNNGDANIAVIIKDAGGRCRGGKLAASHVDGSNGDYIVGFSHEMVLTAGAKYTAVIDADASDTSAEQIAHWEFPFTAQIPKK